MFALLQHLLHPTSCYAICAVARSGAHLLCEGLRATHCGGRPLQYFHHRLALKYAARYGLDAAGQFPLYVRGIVAATATSNGVFGFWTDPWDLKNLVEKLFHSREFGGADTTEIQLLRAAFPRLRCIQLTRQDKLRQAVSKARAMQTNLWVAGKGKSPTGEAHFDAELIRQCREAAIKAEEMWASFFQRNGIEPLAVSYEDLCRDYRQTIGRVLDFLRIRPPSSLTLGPPQTVRQADALSEEWVDQYRQLHPPEIPPRGAEGGGVTL